MGAIATVVVGSVLAVVATFSVVHASADQPSGDKVPPLGVTYDAGR